MDHEVSLRWVRPGVWRRRGDRHPRGRYSARGDAPADSPEGGLISISRIREPRHAGVNVDIARHFDGENDKAMDLEVPIFQMNPTGNTVHIPISFSWWTTLLSRYTPI